MAKRARKAVKTKPRKHVRTVKKVKKARRVAKKTRRPTPKARPAKQRLVKRPKKAARPRQAASLTRARRTLEEPVAAPPSSLDLDRHGSAARSGHAEIMDNLAKHRGMTDVTVGDVDVSVEDAYFSGDEAPGGDNPTPDQDVVDGIGKALGVEYQDAEELKGTDKVGERDKHRWELDPASSEDYKNRK
jgi:hypothetical protein